MYGFCPLASGSRGNCIYFGARKTKILIDAGLSERATKEKLEELNVDLADIKAILITHEHTDHIRGLHMLAIKRGIPVLANSETAKAIYTSLGDCPKFKIFTTGETFTFGDIEIHPFSVQHDAVDPVGFTLRLESLKIGFCTDLGFATTLVQTHLRGCDYLYVEANHHPPMVHASSRPLIYKQRVLSRSGHLSNEACAKLLGEIMHTKLRHIHLAHLSSECNTPETALEAVRKTLGKTVKLSVAFQEKIGEKILFDDNFG